MLNTLRERADPENGASRPLREGDNPRRGVPPAVGAAIMIADVYERTGRTRRIPAPEREHITSIFVPPFRPDRL